MARKSYERPSIRIEGDDHRFIDAQWSRSWKRLIITVRRGGDWDTAQQVELTPEQVQELASFLSAAPDRG